MSESLINKYYWVAKIFAIMHDICKEMQNKMMTLYSKMSDSLKHGKRVMLTDFQMSEQLQLSLVGKNAYYDEHIPWPDSTFLLGATASSN